MRSLLAVLIVLVALGSLALGLPMIFAQGHGGMFAGLSALLGWLVLAAANLLVLALNALFWRLYGAPSWLRIVIWIQVVPAAATLVLLSIQLYQGWRRNQADAQRQVLFHVIESDQAGKLAHAQKQCGKRCADMYLLNAQLLDAAEAGAHKVARALVRQHAAVSSRLGQETVDMRTCEGYPLSSLDALEVAVARGDPAMLGLLFPVSDKGARRRAMWQAAQLDRLDLVRDLAARGVPLSIRGPVLAENDTLLVAAAGGAALNVGKWLIETRHMPVNAVENGPDPYPGTAPAQALMRFQYYAPQSPRIAPFLDMLVAHGADLQVRDRQGRTLLQNAIRARNKGAARLLLDAGARTAQLSVDEKAALAALLARPDEPVYPPGGDASCVKP